jgi:hypothetical protein
MDDDGVLFNDYLGLMQKVLKKIPASYERLVHTHKTQVESNTVKFRGNNRVLSRCLWLWKYHNAVVQTRIDRGYTSEFWLENRSVISPSWA